MYKRKLIILIICLLTTFAFCQKEFKKGEITPIVTCKNDTSQTYSLYLPSTYSESSKTPIIFLFEPAARALLPLEKYGKLAEKYGYILTCSYNSRNGPNEPIFEAANAMYVDCLDRFSPDEKRLFISGFSGGARISCLIALENDKINSAIGTGAGFPYSKLPEQKIGFGYMGIIGEKDMNYQELILLDSVLDFYSSNHILITFEDGHQWPSADTYEQVFYWLETSSMRAGLIPFDQSLIDEIKNNYLEEIEEADIWNRVHLLKNLTLLLTDLIDISLYEIEMEKQKQTVEYKKEIKRRLELRKKEQELHIRYIREFEEISLKNINPEHPVKSQNWWAKEFEMVNSFEDEGLKARLNEFMINGSWEQHFNCIRLKRYESSISYLKIYEAGRPDSPDPNYLQAVTYALMDNKNATLQQLEKALSKGFKDTDRLSKEQAFQKYKDNKKFQRILVLIDGNN